MTLKVALIQMAVQRSDPRANLDKVSACIQQAAEAGCGMACLPEMWTTGFNWEKNRTLAARQDFVLEALSALAHRYRIWINGSMPLPGVNGGVRNTSVLFNDQGRQAARYSKTHLFSLMHEEQHVQAGDRLAVVDTPWGRLGLTICYDIRFPELFRTYALLGVECILSPMAFPNPRLEHCKVLVRARAIENQLYMVGVNQVGSEDFGPDGAVTYFGHSCVIGPWGETLTEADDTSETMLTATLDFEEVRHIRARMTVLQDRRPDLYQPLVTQKDAGSPPIQIQPSESVDNLTNGR
ncbi:MAG: carbon-nitrogen family hydrolase [Spartobacteria bacterium]|nr:carbon-nitrogen family hydrolase [Spartobacteria bacterium]